MQLQNAKLTFAAACWSPTPFAPALQAYMRSVMSVRQSRSSGWLPRRMHSSTRNSICCWT